MGLMPNIMRDYNHNTDYHLVRKAVFEALSNLHLYGPLTRTKQILNENGISFNSYYLRFSNLDLDIRQAIKEYKETQNDTIRPG